MRKLLGTLGVLALLAFAVPAAAGPTSNYIGTPRSPLRYVTQTYAFTTTATITDASVSVCPPGGATLRDVILVQHIAGVGGTSWTATPLIVNVSTMTTPGGFTLAAGADKSTNVAARPITLTNPTGGTRPVLDPTKVTCTGGDVISMTITLSGSYSTAVQGMVVLLWDPKF